MDGYVRQGDPFRPTASQWNRFVSAEKSTPADASVAGQKRATPQAQVWVVAHADLDRFSPVSLSSASLDETSVAFQARHVFASVAPVEDAPFVVLTEPAKTGGMACAVASGPVLMQVKLLADHHWYVRIAADLSVESSMQGYGAILWKGAPDESDVAWCLVDVSADHRVLYLAEVGNAIDDEPESGSPFIYKCDIYSGKWNQDATEKSPVLLASEMWSATALTAGAFVSVFPVGGHWEVVGTAGGSSLPDGTETGNIMHWDDTASKWVVSSVGTLASGDILKWDGTKFVKLTPATIDVVTTVLHDTKNHVIQVKTTNVTVLVKGTEGDAATITGGTLVAFPGAS